jgi:hypothetical protein
MLRGALIVTFVLFADLLFCIFRAFDSVCERYFGLAVAAIIQPTGQDIALQCDLRFVALDHFTLACDNANRANNEQLVVDAATNAWNISMPLIDFPDRRERLQPIQRQVLDNLIKCKGADLR